MKRQCPMCHNLVHGWGVEEVDLAKHKEDFKIWEEADLAKHKEDFKIWEEADLVKYKEDFKIWLDWANFD